MSKKQKIDWDNEEYQIGPEHKGVKKSLRRQRIEICESCEMMTKLKTCGKCGCFLPVKVYFKMFDCPLGKWPSKYS